MGTSDYMERVGAMWGAETSFLAHTIDHKVLMCSGMCTHVSAQYEHTGGGTGKSAGAVQM